MTIIEGRALADEPCESGQRRGPMRCVARDPREGVRAHDGENRGRKGLQGADAGAATMNRPHRGRALKGIRADAQGIMRCRLHGLALDSRTECVATARRARERRTTSTGGNAQGAGARE